MSASTNLDTHTASDMQTNLGSLIGRPDLADEVIADALRERLRDQGRDDDVDLLLASAQNCDEAATSLLRTVAVPAPAARLAMPTQPLTGGGRRFSLGATFGRLSFGR
ncbi:MAG TPA: hypothetical protein VGO17_13180 [Aurantimonas sp.]|jgi:hypothetical protein|nr:hypothetical protein [Aurantimonas sp.]